MRSRSLPRVLAVALASALVIGAGAYSLTSGISPLGGTGDEADSDLPRVGATNFFQPRVTRAKREKERFVPGRVIVRFAPGVSEDDKRDVREDVGVELLRKLPLPGTELVSFSGSRSVDEVRRSLEARPETSYSEPDVIYDISAPSLPNDPSFSSLWGLNNSANTDIDAPEAWSVTTGSAQVTVGIVDTGVAIDHPDLASNIWSNPGESGSGRETNGVDDDRNGLIDDVRGWDWVDRDNDPSDAHGHGTHVAGTVGASGNNAVGVTGVNWQVGLVPLRVLDAQGSGTSSSVAAAFSYAGKMGLDVVNVSLGGPSYSQSVFDAIKGSPNTLFIAAAGNDALDNDQVGSYPCNYPAANIVCVAAVTQTDTLASFSNYGAKTVQLGAPGQSILSTLPILTGVEYGRFSGTSMATPHVAGAAALLQAAVPAAGVSDLRSALLTGAVPIPALQGRTTTGARLNLVGALRSLGVAIPGTEAAPAPVATPVASATPTPSPVVSSPAAVSTPTPTPTPAATPTPSASPPPADLGQQPAPAQPAPAQPAPAQPAPAQPPAAEPAPVAPQPSPSPSGALPSPSPSGALPTPAPVASPTPAPAVAAERDVTLRIVRHAVAKVVVDSPSDPQTCEVGAPVVIKRKGIVVAKGKTSATGRFEARLKDRTGNYTAIVPATAGCQIGADKTGHSHDVALSGEASASELDAFAETCWTALPIERQLRRLHNATRSEGGLRRLRLDGELSKLARAHTEEMVERGSIFHTSNEVLTSRVTGWSYLGENVGFSGTPASLHEAFMASEAHRENILRSNFTNVGVGMVQTGERLWVTVIFKAATEPKSAPPLPICAPTI